MNARPEETIFVGDNPEKDFPGAKKLGIKTVRINRGKYENKKSSSLTVDYEIQNLNELFLIVNSGRLLYGEKEDNCE